MPKSVEIEVQPDVINWILNRIANEEINQNILEQLKSWRDLTAKPRYAEIEKISKKIHIPFGTFFLQKPPKEDKSTIEFRTLNNRNNTNYSLNLEDTYKKMRSIQDWMTDFKKDESEESVEFIGSLTIDTDYSQAAQKVRETLELNEDWNTKFSSPERLFSKIQALLQNNGILFMKNKFVGVDTHHGRKLDVNEFRAFALTNTIAPLIFINQNDSITGQIFSSIHELIHLFLGEDSLFSDSSLNTNSHDLTETFCNKVAAELLVPKNLITEKWGLENEALTDKINRLAKYFNTSRQVIIYRASDLDLINKTEKNHLLAQLKGYDFNLDKTTDENKNVFIPYSAKLKARMDKNFLKALKKSVSNGDTSYTEAMHLTKTNVQNFFNLMEQVSD